MRTNRVKFILLTLLINRYSEDIDLFVKEDQLNNFRNDIQVLLKIDFSKNKSNGGYSTSISNNFKIEILPTNKLQSIKKDGIIFTPLTETTDNKLKALLERDEFRDIYDLAVLSFENRNIFKEISLAHKKKLIISKGLFESNKKLLQVLKNKEFDIEIIKSFYKKLKI